MEIKATVTPPKKLLAKLERYRKDFVKVLAGAMVKEAEDIITKSKKIVPVDTGNLRSTGHVRLPIIDGDNVSVYLGYGGTAAPYAVYVHENLTAKHHEGQQAKYLEQPFNEAKNGLNERVAQRIRQSLK